MAKDPVAVGDTVADVSATLVHPDGSAEETALSDLVDRPVLLAFYTNDFSPDCIDEWCSFRDYDWFATGDDINVVGSSRSRVTTHRQFINHLNLGFPLYSDSKLELAEEFGVVYRAFKVAKRSRRSLFLLDDDLTVRYRWLAEHPLDPTRETPPLDEVKDEIHDLIELEIETFGFN